MHKFSNWVETEYWNESCPKMVSMISCLYKSVYQWDWDDIRRPFLKLFLEQVCEKNNINLSRISEDSVDAVINSSHDYDGAVSEVVDKYYKLFTFESWDFDCQEYHPVDHSDFIKGVIDG